MVSLHSPSYLVDANGAAAHQGILSEQRRDDTSARPRYGANAPTPYVLRRTDELTSFFDGLDMTEPGVVPCPEWRPDGRGPEAASGDTAVTVCGVARKP